MHTIVQYYNDIILQLQTNILINIIIYALLLLLLSIDTY